jgi:hypothetical protein
MHLCKEYCCCVTLNQVNAVVAAAYKSVLACGRHESICLDNACALTSKHVVVVHLKHRCTYTQGAVVQPARPGWHGIYVNLNTLSFKCRTLVFISYNSTIMVHNCILLVC